MEKSIFNDYLSRFEKAILLPDPTAVLFQIEEDARKDGLNKVLVYRQVNAITSRCVNFRIGNWAKPPRKIV